MGAEKGPQNKKCETIHKPQQCLIKYILGQKSRFYHHDLSVLIRTVAVCQYREPTVVIPHQIWILPLSTQHFFTDGLFHFSKKVTKMLMHWYYGKSFSWILMPSFLYKW